MRFFLVFVLMAFSLYASRDGGPYIGGGYGVAKLDVDGYYDLKEDSSNSTKIYAGAYINKNLSVEVEYVGDLAYEVKGRNEFTPNLMDVNTQAHYQFFNEKLDVFAKFGVGEIHYEDKGFTFVYGGGVSWWINEMFLLKFGFDRFDFGYDKDNDNSADKDFKIDYFYSAFEVQF